MPRPYLVIGLALGAGVSLLLLAASFISYSSFKTALDVLAGDGDAERATREVHAALTMALWVCGWAALAATAAVFFFRRGVANMVGRAAASFGDLARYVIREFVSWTRREDRFHLTALTVTCAAGLMLRIYHIFQPMRSDESWTYLGYVSQPVIVALSLYESPNNHVLHTLLAQLSLGIFGDAPWALRLPAFLAGTLLVPAAYFTFRRLYDKNAGLLAAAAVATWPVLIDYSTNARGYSLVVLISMLLIATADRIRRHGDVATRSIFALLAALGLYTIPVFAFPLGAVGLWLLFSALTENPAHRWPAIVKLGWTAVGATAITIALFIPILLTSGLGEAVIVSDESRTTMAAKIGPWLMHIWADWQKGIPLTIGLIGVAGFGWALLRHRAIATHRVPLWIPLIVWCTIVIIALGLFAPARVWLFALPLYAGMAAAGASALLRAASRPHLATSAAIAIVAAGAFAILKSEPGYYYQEFGTMRESEEIVLHLADHLGKNDALVMTFPAIRTVKYYAKHHGLESEVREAVERARVPRTGTTQPFAQLHVVLSTSEQTIRDVFEYHNGLAGTDLLLENFEPVDVRTLGGARVVTLSIGEFIAKRSAP